MSDDEIFVNRACKKLISDSRDCLEQAMQRIDAWKKMEAGDEQALFDLTSEVFDDDIDQCDEEREGS